MLTLPPVPLPEPSGLTPTQTRVAAALAQGATVSGAARQAGIHRTTIHHWLRTEPRFNEAVHLARAEFAATLADELKDLAALGLATLRDLLTNPNTSDSVRLRTALSILNRPDFPKQTWCLPEKLLTEEAQKAETLALIKAEYDAIRMTQPAAKPAAEAPAVTTLIPRSAPCPCGSGQKYKRCCGHNAPPLLSQAA